MAVMPASRCSSTWQWNIHIPTLSGTISAVTNCAGSKEKDVSAVSPQSKRRLRASVAYGYSRRRPRSSHTSARDLLSLHYESLVSC
mgnify:CR=1 FL=1